MFALRGQSGSQDNSNELCISSRMAEMLISKMSHDIANPASATQNGLELLEEEEGDMAREALALVRQGALAVSTRLRIYRLAYGTANGSKGVSNQQFQQLFHDMLGNGSRVRCQFLQTSDNLSDVSKKMLFNLILCGIESLTYGGIIEIIASNHALVLEAKAQNPARPANPEAFVVWDNNTTEPADLNPYIIQSWYAGFYARQQGFRVEKNPLPEGGLRITIHT
jgi:histidine phosphotransferase ChpT